MQKLFALAVLSFFQLSCFAQKSMRTSVLDSSQYSFIENTKPYASIEDVLKLEQFKNKVVYVDLWGYGCAACMRAFKFLPAVKSRYKTKAVAYLYIFYKHADSLSQEVKDNYWRKYAIDNGLTGTHILAYVQPPQTINNGHILSMRERTVMVLNKDIYAIPRYMLADRSGKIQVFDAPGPNEKIKLFIAIDHLLKN